MSPLASGSTVVGRLPWRARAVAQRYRSPTKISRFYLRYLAYRDSLGQNLDILSGPRYLGSDPRYLPYLVISVGALVILPTEISRSKSRYLAWSGPQTMDTDYTLYSTLPTASASCRSRTNPMPSTYHATNHEEAYPVRVP